MFNAYSPSHVTALSPEALGEEAEGSMQELEVRGVAGATPRSDDDWRMFRKLREDREAETLGGHGGKGIMSSGAHV